jgi:hypothetical protein
LRYVSWVLCMSGVVLITGCGVNFHNLFRSTSSVGVSTTYVSIDGGTTYDYGSILASSPVQRIFTVSNAAGAPAATLGAVDTAGLSLAGPFSSTGGTCTNGTILSAGASCTLIVRFTPGSASAFDDEIALAYSDGTSTLSSTRPVHGTGVASVNVWSAGPNASGALSDRFGVSTVWTGSEMLIWGGNDGGDLDDGGRYNPTSDTWGTPITTTSAPSARYGASAVWTGSEMLIWGGWVGSGTTNTGKRYNPGTNTWGANITTSGAPSARLRASTVWTGTEMIIWGGEPASWGVTNTGGRYTAGTNTWGTAPTTSGAPSARNCAATAWTGTEMLVWGGYDGTSEINTGGRYNPTTDTWGAAISTAGAPAARTCASAVWSGSEMIVWGGYDLTLATAFADGGRYNPVTNTWGSIATSSAPAARSQLGLVWTGTRMIVWGGLDTSLAMLGDGGVFTP